MKSLLREAKKRKENESKLKPSEKDIQQMNTPLRNIELSEYFAVGSIPNIYYFPNVIDEAYHDVLLKLVLCSWFIIRSIEGLMLGLV